MKNEHSGKSCQIIAVENGFVVVFAEDNTKRQALGQPPIPPKQFIAKDIGTITDFLRAQWGSIMVASPFTVRKP